MRVIVVIGGYRTGSTLQYNLVGHYLEAAGLGRRLGLVDPDDVAVRLLPELERSDDLLVAKCHHLAEGFGRFENPTAWRPVVESGIAVPISTTRDRADVERSMCRKFGIAPEELHESTAWRVDAANRAAWSAFAPFEQTYDRLVGEPAEAVRELADALGLPWSAAAAELAVERSSVQAALRESSQLERGTWDPVSLLHWDHISPESSGS